LVTYFAATGVADNCKKIKRNSFDARLGETSSTVTSVIVAQNTNNTDNINNINNTNKQQNENTSASKSSENGKNDKDPSECTILETTNISNSLSNNQKNNLPIQSIPFPKADNVQHMEQIANLEKDVTVKEQQNKENSVAHRNTDFVTFSKSNPIFLQALPSINGFYLEQIPNPFIGQNARTDKPNVYAIPTNSIILPSTDNITMLSNQTVLVNQPIVASVTPILNNNQMTVNRQEAIRGSRRLVPTGRLVPRISNAGNNSSNKSYVSNLLRIPKVITLKKCPHNKNLKYFIKQKKIKKTFKLA